MDQTIRQNQVTISDHFAKQINDLIQSGENVQNYSLMAYTFQSSDDPLHIEQLKTKKNKHPQNFSNVKQQTVNEYLNNLDFSNISYKEVTKINIEQIAQKRFNGVSDYIYSKYQDIKTIFNELSQKILKFHFDIKTHFNKALNYYVVQVSYSQILQLEIKLELLEKDLQLIDNFICFLLMKWIYPKEFFNLFFQNGYQDVPKNVDNLFENIFANDECKDTFKQFEQNNKNIYQQIKQELLNELLNSLNQTEESVELKTKIQKQHYKSFEQYQYIDNMFDVANLKLNEDLQILMNKTGTPLNDVYVQDYPYQKQKVQIIYPKKSKFQENKNHLQILERISKRFYENEQRQLTKITENQKVALQKDFDYIKESIQKFQKFQQIQEEFLDNQISHIQLFKNLTALNLYFQLKIKFDSQSNTLNMSIFNRNNNEFNKVSSVSLQKQSPNQFTKYLKMYFIINSFKQFNYQQFKIPSKQIKICLQNIQLYQN